MQARTSSAAPGLDLTTSLGAIVDSLRDPTAALLRATVLRPLILGPGVEAVWSLTRDMAVALVVVVLLYGVLRAQIGPMLGADGGHPWGLLPRLVMSLIGIALSLPMVRALLALNNALCATLISTAPGGATGLMHPLAGGIIVAGPVVLGIGPDVVAVVVLGGLAALACSYVIRAAEIVLLTLLLPLAMALWLVPAATGVYRTIVAHLLVAVFVQSLQQIVLLVFATGSVGPAAPGLGWLWALASLAMLFRCRRLLNAAAHAVSDWVPRPGDVLATLAPAVAASGWSASRLRALAGGVYRATGF